MGDQSEETLQPNPKRVSNAKFAIRALSHRNYRLFFAGQGISLIGTWMQQTAIGWVVYEITGSAKRLGLISFAGLAPMFVLSPFAGVLIDRWNRLRSLKVTQTLSLLQAFVIAILAFTHQITVWRLFGLALFLGTVNAVDMPTRQAFVVDMLEDRRDLPNAVALNSSMFNGARLIGPVGAGLLMAYVGTGWCFTLNGISFVAVLMALMAMRIRPRETAARNGPILRELREGLRYSWESRSIRAVLILRGLVGMVGMPYITFLPIFARDILHGGPSTLGILSASVGVGALVGAFSLAGRRDTRGLSRVVGTAAIIFGVGVIAFSTAHYWVPPHVIRVHFQVMHLVIALSFTRLLVVSMLLMAVCGYGMMTQMASSNTYLQTVVHDDKRGRVMSLFTVAFAGTKPIGDLSEGYIAQLLGAPLTLAGGGLISIFGAIGYLIHMRERKQL